jgi:hypothetical protein
VDPRRKLALYSLQLRRTAHCELLPQAFASVALRDDEMV